MSKVLDTYGKPMPPVAKTFWASLPKDCLQNCFRLQEFVRAFVGDLGKKRQDPKPQAG